VVCFCLYVFRYVVSYLFLDFFRMLVLFGLYVFLSVCSSLFRFFFISSVISFVFSSVSYFFVCVQYVLVVFVVFPSVMSGVRDLCRSFFLEFVLFVRPFVIYVLCPSAMCSFFISFAL